MTPLRLLAFSLVAALLAGCIRDEPPAPVVDAEASQNAAPAHAPPPAPVETAATKLTVRPGQTLYALAREAKVPVRAIIDANHLQPPYKLQVGPDADGAGYAPACRAAGRDALRRGARLRRRGVQPGARKPSQPTLHDQERRRADAAGSGRDSRRRTSRCDSVACTAACCSAASATRHRRVGHHGRTAAAAREAGIVCPAGRAAAARGCHTAADAVANHRAARSRRRSCRRPHPRRHPLPHPRRRRRPPTRRRWWSNRRRRRPRPRHRQVPRRLRPLR